MNRLRIQYEKLEGLRYTGNLDIHKLWERTFRRAGLDLAYSQGFHPQPRLQQAFPVPLGFISRCSYVDVWLNDDLGPEKAQQKLGSALHPSIHILSIEEVDMKAPALQTLIVAADFVVFLDDVLGVHGLQDRIEALLHSATLVRERRGKTYDLRPLIQQLGIDSDSFGKPVSLTMRLSTLPGATGRPEEVLQELSISISDVKMEHTALTFKTDSAGV